MIENINVNLYNTPIRGFLMSIQKDSYILYTMAAGEYSACHDIPLEQVYRLFEEHQVMAKFVAHHEILHQRDFSFTWEYLNKILSDDKEMIIYHGTVYSFEDIDLKKSRDNLDFGKGFYTTILESQAKDWGLHLAKMNHKDKYNLKSYSFYPKPDLLIKKFDEVNEEWLEMIKENRVKGGVQHSYDVVIGPVADDRTLPTIYQYINHEISAFQAIQQLKYEKINNQVGFHTEKALQSLWTLKTEEFDAHAKV